MLPCPGRFSALISPPCASTTERAIASPIRSLLPRAPGLVGPVEALEEPREVFGRDAGSRIRDGDLDGAVPAAGGDGDAPPCGVYRTALSTRLNRT